MEEAENRGWLRNTKANSRRWGSKRRDVWVYELMVTTEGELGVHGHLLRYLGGGVGLSGERPRGSEG